MSLTEIIDEHLEVYIEEDDLLVDDEYNFDEEKSHLTFKVDIVTEEIDVSILFEEGGGAKIDIGDYQVFLRVGHHKRIMEKVMTQIVATRDKNLELTTPQSPGLNVDTPGGGWDEFDPFRNLEEQDQNSLEFPETPLSPEFNALYADCEICSKLFGKISVTVIYGTSNIRLTVLAKYIEPEVRLMYGISEQTSVTLSLSFTGKDYMEVEKEPTVSGSFIGNAFGEQVLNIARVFVNERWNEYKIKVNPRDLKTHPPLSFIEEKIHKLADHSTLEYRRQIARKDLIKKYIRDRQEEYAMSLCLLSNGMNIGKAVQDFEELGGTLLERNDLEKIKSLNITQPNFPLEILTFLTLRMASMTNHCSICDRYIFCQIEKKPTVCTNFKCQFDYISQKRCASIPQAICPQTICQDLRDNPNIVDILISLCYCACKHNRKDVIFKPFPPMYLKNNNTRDYESLYRVFDKLPSVEVMSRHSKNEMTLKGFLGMEAYELVQWILAAKRVAMVRMTEKRRIEEMGTEFQYMLLIDDPNKTTEFEKSRDQYGSFFAFHGSGLQNWHSILRRGLLVGSGTDLQTTGAAFGKGIYLSPNSSTSMGYSRVGNSWPKSKFGVSGVKLIAICEVVRGPGVPTSANPHYVVNLPQFVTCRFFCWYSTGQGKHGVDIAKLDLHSKYLDGKGKKGKEDLKKK